MSMLDRLRYIRLGYANLNKAAIWWKAPRGYAESSAPFTDPGVTAHMVRDLHKAKHIDASYGGWLEDRSTLWRGTYLEKEKLWIHTGVDLNLSQGSVIQFLAPGKIVYIGNDTPLRGGWGGHVIQKIRFREKTHALIYAHLEVNRYLRVGDVVGTEHEVGLVGGPEHNGYWFPHLHLQLFADVGDVSDWDAFSKQMDGYVKESHRAVWARRCPDPTPLLFGVK